MSINTTTNKFYETVNFDKGDSAKALILPSENAKADLGSTTKKYDKLYVNDIPGRAKEITRGTWTPSFDWSTQSSVKTPPSSSTRLPTKRIIEAKYEKVGKRAYCFCVFSLTIYRVPYSYLYSSLGGLPFKIYQRASFLDGGIISTSGNATNVFTYLNSTYNDILFSGRSQYPLLFVNLKDANRKSMSYNPVTYWALTAPIPISVQTRYYYAKFNYRTEN